MKVSVRVGLLSCVAIVTLFSWTARCAAQSSQQATLTGAIFDPRDAVISGAKISVILLAPEGASHAANAETEPQTLSNSEGRFELTVPPGRYRLSVTHESFSRLEEEITLTSGEKRDLQAHLALEPLSASVVVTADALPIETSSTSAPVDIITRQQIDDRQATSLPDLLSSMPGFSIGRNGPEGGVASLFLDGGNSTYTKVLVDGVPVNRPGGQIDFSNFTVDNVDKIEVVHGAESALYGSDAMTGVVQIFTRRGTTKTPDLSLFAEGGNFASGRGGVDLSGLLGRFDYSAAAADLETQGQGPNDAFRNRTLSGNFGWQLPKNGRIDLALRDNDSTAGEPGQTLLVPPNLTDNIALHDFSAGLNAQFSTGTHWQHQVSGTESYNRQNAFDPFFTSFSQYNRANFEGQSTYRVKGFALTAGYEYEVENGFLSDIGQHVRRNNQAGFLDAQWQPLARLTLNAGARAEDNANFGTRVVPRAGVAYAVREAQGPFGDTRLRASYGQGILEPEFDQSFGNDPCFPGNPNLLPERSRTLHAGVDQKLAGDRVRVTADYFDSRFRDIISFQSATPSAPCLAIGAPFGAGTYFNTNLARARGTNLTGEARLVRWLTASVNYTHDSTRVLSAPNDFDPNYLPGNRLLRRPVYAGNVVLNAAYRRLDVNVAGYFVGKRADSDFLGFGLTSNPGYGRMDLAASYRLDHGVSFYARIANLTDRQYQDVIGYPALGRNFRVGVRYTTHRE